MQLVISICFPDGSLPTAERIRYYKEEDASQTLTEDWTKDSVVYVNFPSGLMVCRVLALITTSDHSFGGEYFHAMLQEESFQEYAGAQARLQ